jgi:hypothetical protein
MARRSAIVSSASLHRVFLPLFLQQRETWVSAYARAGRELDARHHAVLAGGRDAPVVPYENHPVGKPLPIRGISPWVLA